MTESKETEYGRYGCIIPEDLISFAGRKYHKLTIKNSFGKQIIYDEIDKGYRMFTDDPMNTFLTNDDVASSWEPFNWFDELVKNYNINLI